MRTRVWAAALILATASSASAETGHPGWIADAATGCRVWNDHPQLDETITWSGACRNGLAQGQGVLQWLQGGRPAGSYEGELRDGRATGHGVWTTSSGDRAEGEFVDGWIKGHAVIIWANGNHYDGDSVAGKPNGHGVFIWTNGDRYEGDFVDGAINGRGLFTWANGNRYAGK